VAAQFRINLGVTPGDPRALAVERDAISAAVGFERREIQNILVLPNSASSS